MSDATSEPKVITPVVFFRGEVVSPMPTEDAFDRFSGPVGVVPPQTFDEFVGRVQVPAETAAIIDHQRLADMMAADVPVI